MRLPRAPSLLARLLGVQLLTLALIWVVLSGFAIYQAYRDDDNAIDSDLTLVANALARVTSVNSGADQARILADHLRDLSIAQADPPLTADQFAYQVWTADSVLLARSQESPELPALGPGTLPEGRKQSRHGWTLLAVRSPNGKIVAVVGHTDAYYRRVTRFFIWQLVRGYLQLEAILTALLWVTLRVGLRPLNQLAVKIRARQRDDLTPIAVEKSYSELDPLVSSLNDKLAKVRAALEREREFFADAAHELRTPLTAISAQAHVVITEPGHEEREAAAIELQNGVERAARVLNRLLLVSRLDAARELGSTQSVDLGEIVDDVVSQNRARARTSGHRITATTEPLLRSCNREHLTAALECLVDNALKYTPTGTHIVLTAHADGANTVLTVADDGPGIATDLQALAFKRFERLGQTDQEGSGLGLAIVQRVADLHGGGVTVRRSAGGGCLFEMRLPLAPAPATA
jgi:signal transduction histidine kinase